MAPIGKKTKILYLSTKSVLGGAQRYILDLAENLPRDQYDIIVAAGGSGALKNKVISQGIVYHEIPYLERDIHMGKDFISFLKILKLLSREKPDILHLNGSKVSLVGALAGKIAGVKKIISSTHGWPFLESRPRLTRKFLKAAGKMGAVFHHTIICVSQFDYLVALKEGIAPPRKLTVIQNGIAPQKHIFLERKIAQEKLFGITGIKNDNYFIIGTIAEYTKNKGLYYIIEAANQITAIKPKTRFFIMGWGAEKEFLKNQIAAHHLQNNVFLIENLPEAFTYLKALDVFILPSLKEGFAYTLLEASLAELPIIATRVGGNPEIIENLKTGLLVSPASPEEIINAIGHLMGNPDERALLGKNAREKVIREFPLSHMVKKTLAVYEKD